MEIYYLSEEGALGSKIKENGKMSLEFLIN